MTHTNPRQVKILKYGWRFAHGDIEGAETTDYNDGSWDQVRVPHDWAIGGPFSEDNDAQYTAIGVDGETKKRTLVGRTGGLPHVGKAWYRLPFDLTEDEAGKSIRIEFDGVMSHSTVYCNGKPVGSWPFGYASFAFDLSEHVHAGSNLLAVSVDNKPESSRWYPGAGIYRHVRLVFLEPAHVAHWGTNIATPEVRDAEAVVRVRTAVESSSSDTAVIKLRTEIRDADGNVVATAEDTTQSSAEHMFDQTIRLPSPHLWGVDDPYLYLAVSSVWQRETLTDQYRTTFGVRELSFDPDGGFGLNGQTMKLNGVCMHHDLGPIGTAVNRDALKRQLVNLKEMGCNAVRTSHNPPTPELLDLCDRLGILVLDEAFDEWRIAKVENGYHILFDEWAEKDLRAMIRRDRNHACVFAWSIGNEILEQGVPDGDKTAQFLADICHDEDPSRPTTAGFNDPDGAIKNGMADVVDLAGWNYQPNRYYEYKLENQKWISYGSETASCVSSRGVYHFPPEEEWDLAKDDLQVSSYDLASPEWGCSPEVEFHAQDQYPHILGEFVWTGWDYLGEPTPYMIEWPSRSSYFGIVDLCGIPKDRYYLYQAQWSDRLVLHLLPHWTWPGREGELIPVHCYTSYDAVELFVNGESKGRRSKQLNSIAEQYRLIWNDVRYAPGEIKVVAFDADGKPAREEVVKTAGPPVRLEMHADRTSISADGDSMVFVRVQVVDAAGILCPSADNEIEYAIDGPVEVVGIGNGDPTSLQPFPEHHRRVFGGLAVVYARSISGEGGPATIKAQSAGLQSSAITIETESVRV
jgi:beta-galactosidase